MKSLNIQTSDMPEIFLTTSEQEDGYLRFSGELLESSLSEWVLRNSPPGFQELSLSVPNGILSFPSATLFLYFPFFFLHLGEFYATQFFTSRKLKFLLFLTADQVSDQLIDSWRRISSDYQSQAIFTYITQKQFLDLHEFFQINYPQDLPCIVAYNPLTDSKYKITNLLSLSSAAEEDEEEEEERKERANQSSKSARKIKSELNEFVKGVMSGRLSKIVKSEPVPKNSVGYVPKIVGANLYEMISQPDKDILLFIYVPYCEKCKKLFATFDLLGRAIQSESRLQLYKIDGIANDLPTSWSVRQYPTLLWFPASDKPYYTKNIDLITPKPYWEAGYSLQELYSFIRHESSFEADSLKIATIEQLGSLLNDEPIFREKYEKEEQHFKRNEGRVIYESELMDWIFGEVIFDGKRWHLGAAGLIATTWILMVVYILLILITGEKKKKKPSHKPTREQKELEKEQEDEDQKEGKENDDSGEEEEEDKEKEKEE
jgi:hypothetical protein